MATASVSGSGLGPQSKEKATEEFVHHIAVEVSEVSFTSLLNLYPGANKPCSRHQSDSLQPP